MHFTISRLQKKIKAQPGEEAASSPVCAIGAFIGLDGQKCIKKTRIWLWYDYRSLKLNMMLKIEFQKIKVAYGLIKDIRGYHIHLWSCSTSSI
jgi:high-affinity Fe2+/Pb2+ permease